MMYLMLFILLLIIMEKIFKPRLDWNYETEKLLFWYNSGNTRKYITI